MLKKKFFTSWQDFWDSKDLWIILFEKLYTYNTEHFIVFDITNML